MKTIASGMLRSGTPVQDYSDEYGLFVKREDLACPRPGPPFSKTRGVYAHVAKRPERLIGVLDTFHSQAGHAVARACQVLGKKCINYYPEYKDDTGLRNPQVRSRELGATLVSLKAGRSCILYHVARKEVEAEGGYMMPNALKLAESVEETAKEIPPGDWERAIIPSSSATIAAGVVRGMAGRVGTFVIHLGYSRSGDEVRRYVQEASGVPDATLDVIDEGYAYKDVARAGETPPWPCNQYYDLKAFRWWIRVREGLGGRTLFWNVG